MNSIRPIQHNNPLCYPALPHYTSRSDPLLLRKVPEQKACRTSPGIRNDSATRKSIRRDESILCRHCSALITKPAENIRVQGSHRHTFANPAGILYQIVCFRNARGCSYLGPATEQWSWFAGYSWRVAVCRACSIHVGWLFLGGTGNGGFHGLIESRLSGTR